MTNFELPLITLRMEGFRHSVCMMLADLNMEIDQHLKASVEAQLSDENVHAMIEETAKREVDKAIRSSIEEFFAFGEGRDAIRDAVQAKLKESL